MHKKRELLFSNSLIFKWCHRESNQGHKDFQSFALRLVWECKSKSYFGFCKIFCKNRGKSQKCLP